jgi:hypothetical protein
MRIFGMLSRVILVYSAKYLIAKTTVKLNCHLVRLSNEEVHKIAMVAVATSM